MKLRSPKLTENSNNSSIDCKKAATGNGNSKPEIESNQYSMLAAALPMGCHTYSPAIVMLPALPYLQTHGCGLLPHIVWTFRRFVSLQSAGGRFRFRVPPSATTCLSTSHLRRHSRFSDNDSRPFCFPVPAKTLSYDSCVTITIHHYCLDTRGPCNN